MASYSSGASQGASASHGSSSSESTPLAIQTPQSEFELQLSQLLDQLGQDQYNWAQDQFNTASSVTDAQINNYLNEANQASYAASNLWGRYQNVYEPLSNQWIQEAGSYASTPRIQFNMGQAQSQAAQAGTQAENNAAEQLNQYGIDPSSGMYGELTEAANAQRAASAAAAGQESELSTEQTGRSMLQTAIAQGEQLPGASVNEMNTALGGIAGAENSILGLENTGVNLMDSASPYFSSAMALKYPQIGNQSSSESQNASVSENSSANQSSNSGNGGGSTTNINGGGYVPDGGMVSGYTGDYAASSAATPASASSSLDYDEAAAEQAGEGAMGSSFGGAYARGGEAGNGMIPHNSARRGTSGTSGGYVPRSASPSGGRQTDDIPARLNAREFVIPQDVTDWMGQKFFQDVINKARKARQDASASGHYAQGQMKPSLAHMPPRFVSHHIPLQRQGLIPSQMGAPNGR